MKTLKWRLMETPPDDGGGGDGGSDGGGSDDGGGGEPSPDRTAIESEAKGMGWSPKEEWRGAPERWRDAPEFVQQGKTFIPYLQHQTKKLRGELSSRDQQIATLSSQVAEANNQLRAITEFNEEMAKDRLQRRKVEIGTELRAAREASDDVRVAELQNELGDVIKPKAAPTPPPQERQPTQPQILPWVQSFLTTHDDFFQNPRKVALFNVEMLERRRNGDGRVGDVDGTALLSEAKEAVERQLGGNPRRQAPSKTEDSRPGGMNGGGGGGGVGGRTYAEMPADARAKCDAQEARFVGDGKAFKKQADWRKHFVSEYFGPSASAMSRAQEG